MGHVRTLAALLVLIFFLPDIGNAATGPLAKDFGADDWLDKIHVIFSVFAVVAVTTLILVVLILRKRK
tara:strand:- start:130 stop:333 length:204 start_codon:yes stop_codon:yes gene_type:complete